MEIKEEVINNRKSHHQNVKRSSDGLRRPFGVAGIDGNQILTQYSNLLINTSSNGYNGLLEWQNRNR